ncbi:MAG: tRNA 2-thiocytidine biosynthesis protein TtcA [Bacteroidaceae bacterium]|nr:tRNA 2-thiocytidine biosynthesis protein TtcA [Bacteroidaceae bacterium]
MKRNNEQQMLFKRLNERFVKAFATYKLLEDNDRVLIGLSGGKDSLLLTELLGRRAQIHHPRFSVEAVHVRMENISYETSTDYLQQFCDHLQIPLHVVTTSFDTSLRQAQDKLSSAQGRHKPPCFLCSWNRRKQMFNLAQELGCNKIALGHHRDDLIHTALMNLTFQGRFGTMPARLQMRKMPLSIIRPLCLIDEADICRYAQLSGYQQVTKLCPYEHDTNRTSVANLFAAMEAMNPEARFSVWQALESAGKLVEE